MTLVCRAIKTQGDLYGCCALYTICPSILRGPLSEECSCAYSLGQERIVCGRTCTTIVQESGYMFAYVVVRKSFEQDKVSCSTK